MCLRHDIYPHSDHARSRSSQARQPSLHDLPHRHRLHTSLSPQYQARIAQRSKIEEIPRGQARTSPSVYQLPQLCTKLAVRLEREQFQRQARRT